MRTLDCPIRNLEIKIENTRSEGLIAASTIQLREPASGSRPQNLYLHDAKIRSRRTRGN
jgi:hypothetical protein